MISFSWDMGYLRGRGGGGVSSESLESPLEPPLQELPIYHLPLEQGSNSSISLLVTVNIHLT